MPVNLNKQANRLWFDTKRRYTQNQRSLLQQIAKDELQSTGWAATEFGQWDLISLLSDFPATANSEDEYLQFLEEQHPDILYDMCLAKNGSTPPHLKQFLGGSGDKGPSIEARLIAFFSKPEHAKGLFRHLNRYVAKHGPTKLNFHIDLGQLSDPIKKHYETQLAKHQKTFANRHLQSLKKVVLAIFGYRLYQAIYGSTNSKLGEVFKGKTNQSKRDSSAEISSASQASSPTGSGSNSPRQSGITNVVNTGQDPSTLQLDTVDKQSSIVASNNETTIIQEIRHSPTIENILSNDLEPSAVPTTAAHQTGEGVAEDIATSGTSSSYAHTLRQLESDPIATLDVSNQHSKEATTDTFAAANAILGAVLSERNSEELAVTNIIPADQDSEDGFTIRSSINFDEYLGTPNMTPIRKPNAKGQSVYGSFDDSLPMSPNDSLNCSPPGATNHSHSGVNDSLDATPPHGSDYVRTVTDVTISNDNNTSPRH